MRKLQPLALVVSIFFVFQTVYPYPLLAGTGGYVTPQELHMAQSGGFVPASSSVGNTAIGFLQVTATPGTTTLVSQNNLVRVTIPAAPAVQSSPTLSEQWEGAQQQYGIMAPLMMIGAVTNPIIEAATGIKAGSPQAKEIGEDIYKWTGGLFNVPMTVLLGKSLSDPYSTGSMGLEERGEYLIDHPLEVVEYAGAVYAGAGLISGGAGAALSSAGTSLQGIVEDESVSALSKGVSIVKLAYGPLAAAAKPIFFSGAIIGYGAYEYNKETGTYKVGVDANGSPVIVDSQGKPQVVDVLSAQIYGMGAKADHIFGDFSFSYRDRSEADAFSSAMYSQGVSSNLLRLSKDLGTNEDGSINWAGKMASIPLQAVNAPFAFAEFPFTYGDNIVDAQIQGWTEGIRANDLGKGLTNSSIYTAQAIGGSALGMYSFAGDALVAGPVNFVDAVAGGNGKVLPANWLGTTVANAPYIDALGLGKYFNSPNPAGEEYPNIDYTLANGPFMFNLRESALGSDSKLSEGEREPGFIGGLVDSVDSVRAKALKPVDILTLPLNVGLEKAGSMIIDTANDIHDQAGTASQESIQPVTQGQLELSGRISENSPQQYDFVKDAPILAYQITSGEFSDIPEAIRNNMGTTDQTTYTREYLEKNIGSVIALQMNGDKPDFYIIGKDTFDQKYRVVAPEEVGAKNAKLMDKLAAVPGIEDVVNSDPNLVGALKQASVPMIRMSDLGYDVDAQVTIQSPWGEQTKPAGQDAFLVYDAGAKQYYMVNTDPAGNPISYVTKKSVQPNG